ncbi:Filamentous haemagglutinin-like protein [Sulfurimonas denitrificans DSM 1251]|uniref:Filamentous haemagglutinin-like protein n=1 Tax=Sulfurimonas denitrificans (strain ATCC 33889 / DSM 1251) TaxID=326298 RepID=Q30SK4_SULDN|nr:filamentous hemagglutinin N-terminal domain-containing protein [Sulfurimonas denitrificans]ABB44027.1 Filamentous haemagglutinin-like protein [Sulfurimonas denitrificans DSM 1251]
MKYNPDFSSRFRILKGGKISLVVSALIGSITILSASPTGGVVTSGVANISQSGSATNITQSSQKATINWQNFSIGANETVNFAQPNVNAIALNRVVGNERSVIEGALNANGQVWILNSNGVLFNKSASINTAGLVATTKNISDADFNAGNYNFTGESTASVINMGTINITDGGYASLLANSVRNDGTITAIRGKVTLTGASEATINLNGNSLVNLRVDKGVLDALVENKGAIYADGGEIYLTTNAVNELLKGVVNNTGIIEANSIDGITGKVELFAHGGTAQVAGTIEAKDGFVETSGRKLDIADDINIKANTWLLDPYNLEIVSDDTETILTDDGGGNGMYEIVGSQDNSKIKASTIETQLNSESIAIVYVSTHNDGVTEGTQEGNIYM